MTTERKSFQIDGIAAGSPLGASGHIPRGVKNYIDGLIATIRAILATKVDGQAAAARDLLVDGAIQGLVSGKVDKVAGAALVPTATIVTFQEQIAALYTQITLLKDMGKVVVISGAGVTAANGSYQFVGGYEASRVWELAVSEGVLYTITYSDGAFVLSGHITNEEDVVVITPLYRAVAEPTESPWTAELVWEDSWGEGLGADDDSTISVA